MRKEIKHPRLAVLKGQRDIESAARALDEGDVSPLATGASAHWSDIGLAARVGPKATAHLRRWMIDGKTSTIRTNALSIVAKLSGRANAELVVEALRKDEKVRTLCLASIISRTCQLDWDTSIRIAKDPSTAPNPQLLAGKLAHEATSPKDTESRWCSAYLLQELAPVLAR
ncbi:XRE family transcriptional regulator [Actinocrispum wychmicini]|uniref:XRE family transcriptional regulator n=1 Tax=Actinocrispum wychmicini TaxID=1213861 RepID=UPI001048D61C|nr:XRE family transcriptional regulator [Actinocrispum wychmicini]